MIFQLPLSGSLRKWASSDGSGETFNSLSRDHCVITFRVVYVIRNSAFNSLSRDHFTVIVACVLVTTPSLSTPSLGITTIAGGTT